MAEFDAGAGSGARIPRGGDEGRRSGKAGDGHRKRHRHEDPTERIETRYDPDEDDEESELRRAKSLVSAALDARERAYAPYSRFKVGAAVVTEKGVFVGVNVENASYPLSVCAERNAIAAAVAAGARRLFAVAVVADSSSPVAPCGGCRQVLSEFGKTAKVYLANLGGEIRTTTVRDLLPHSFGRADLGGAGA